MSSTNTTIGASSSRMQALLAKYREEKAALAQTLVQEAVLETAKLPEPARTDNQILDKHGNLITLNDKQAEFVRLAGTEGESAVLIGAAGTGKTTCQKAVVQARIQSGEAGLISADGHKHLVQGSPGIIICAYTRRAVANIRRNMPTDLQSNCITIHKLLEYSPVYYEVIDETTGDTRNKMVFEPTRTALNPLPSSIRTIIFEESSMIGTDLHQQVIDACPHSPQIIYLGDIQQLPPVFGPAILGFKLLELPVVELTEVYRQALESPIISLAHRVLSGNIIPAKEYSEWKKPNQLTIHPWKKKISAEDALYTAGQFFIQAEKNGIYDPEEDIILIPFNKSFGTDELNKILANHLARKRETDTYEIIAGFNKIYLSVGDKVLYDKEDAIVTKIETNNTYTGAPYQKHSKTLDYWGHDPVVYEDDPTAGMSDDGIDFLLSQVASKDSDDRVRQASHIITLQMLDSDLEIKIDKASEINQMALGLVLTFHKSQGSEYRKVFLVLHQSHATMVSRELLYTGITRAKEELYIIAEPETFTNGIRSQRVKGDTLAEKAKFFMGKLDEGKYKP